MAFFGIKSTFTTQRYEPHLRWQASSNLGSAKTTDATITTHSHHSRRLSTSTITIKESPNHGQCLQRVLSPMTSSSPSPSTALSHEDRSTGVCTTTNTELFEGHFSPSTSVTSFHLSADQHTMSAVNGEKNFVTGVKEQWGEKMLSASQVEAHIPPRASVDSYTTATREGNEEAEIWQQVHLVSPISVCVVGTSRNPTPSTTLHQTTTAPPSISHCFHQAHPEYDSDYDEYTDDVGSFQSSFSGSSGLAEDEAEENDSLDFCDPEVTLSPIASTSLLSDKLDHSDPALPFPSPTSSSSSSLPSPIRFRPLNTDNARNKILSHPGEEVPVIASTSRQPTFTKNSGSTSSLPDVQQPTLDTTPPSSPASSAVDRDVWWRNFPMHFRRVPDSRPECRSVASAEERRSGEPNRFHLSHGDQRMGDNTSSGEVGPMGEKTPPPPPPLSPALSCPNASRHTSSQTKSRFRGVLSVILPCIPISGEGNFDETTVGPEQASSTATNLAVTSMRRGLTNTRGGTGKRGLTKQKSTGTLLEVKVDRHVSHRIDWNSA